MATQTKNPQVEGEYDPSTGRICCPQCHKFRGKLTSKQAQHYCPDCKIEIITSQPSKALLIHEVNQSIQQSLAIAAQLLPLIQQLPA